MWDLVMRNDVLAVLKSRTSTARSYGVIMKARVHGEFHKTDHFFRSTFLSGYWHRSGPTSRPWAQVENIRNWGPTRLTPGLAGFGAISGAQALRSVQWF